MVELIDLNARRRKKYDRCPCQLELYPEIQERLEQLWHSKAIPHVLAAFCHGLEVMLRQFTHHDGRYQTDEMLEFYDEILFILELSNEITSDCNNQALSTVIGFVCATSEAMKGDEKLQELLNNFKIISGGKDD